MKLNNKEKIILCQKGLSTQQLRCYANLCRVYNDLAIYANDNSRSSINIERRYATALTKATQGDLRFLEDSDCIFSSHEKSLIEKYSRFANILQDYNTASDILKSALPKENPNSINKEAIKDFTDYMQTTSSSTKKFIKNLNDHSKLFLGHDYYVTANRSISAIENIDMNHLPDSITQITPALYGATIKGYRTTLRTFTKDAENIFNNREQRSYSQPVGFFKDKKDRFIDHHGKQIAKAALAGLMTSAAFGAYEVHNYQEIYNTQTTNYNAENNLKQYYSDDLISDVLSLFEDVKKLKPYVTDNLTQKQISELSDLQDEISQIREKEDIIISDYMSEVGQKYCEQKGYQFVEATNAYDELRNKKAYKSSEGETYIYEVENPDLRKAENYLELTYIDSDGNTKQTELSEFNSSILETFEWEKKLDRTPTIKDLIDISDGINNLVGKDVKYSKVLGIHPIISKETEKAQEKVTSSNQTSTLNTENSNRTRSSDDDYEK